MSQRIFERVSSPELSEEDITSSPAGLHNWLDRVWGIGFTSVSGEKKVIICSIEFAKSQNMTKEEITHYLETTNFPVVEKIRLPQGPEIFLQSSHHVVFDEFENERISERSYLVSLRNFSIQFCDAPFNSLGFTKFKRPKREIVIQQVSNVFQLISNGNQFSNKNLPSKIIDSQTISTPEQASNVFKIKTSMHKNSPVKRIQQGRMNVSPSKVAKITKKQTIQSPPPPPAPIASEITPSQVIQSSPPKVGKRNKRVEKAIPAQELDSNSDFESPSPPISSDEDIDIEEEFRKAKESSNIIIIDQEKKSRRKSLQQVEKQRSEDVAEKVQRKRKSINVLATEKDSVLHKVNLQNCLGIFHLPPSRLGDPSPEYKIRDPDMDFVELLKSSIQANSYADVAPIIVNVEVEKGVVKEYKDRKSELSTFLQSNKKYHFHTIGGNHSRLAYQALTLIDEKFDATRLVKIFINLSRDEAELLGAEHNKANIVV
jgi:hypothetical protein